MKRLLIFLLCVFSNSTFAQQIRVSYVGNMGVMVSSTDSQLLIDALHEQYDEDYLFPPRHLTDSIIRGIKPYHQIKYLLFTHRHRDHFSRNLTTQFLVANPQSILLTHAQIADSLPTLSQIVRINKQQPLVFTNGNVSIQPVFLRHTWQQRHRLTDNFGYIVKVKDKTLLHLGDAEYDPDDFEANQHLFADIDVAIVPTWFVLDEKGKYLLSKYIKAKKVIVTHISPLEKMMAYKKLDKNMVPFFRIGQSILIQ
jgi:L-ascorbate metabolism protein UlaG (beta-lactamase superfamily)